MRSELREAMRLHREGAIDKAERLYRKLLLTDPGDAIATHYLGLLTLDRTDVTESLGLLENSIALDPSRSEFRLNLGLALLKLGMWEKAIPNFQSCIADNPSLIAPHVGLGRALLSVDRATEALRHFDRALALGDRSTECQIGRVGALMRLKRLQEALDQLDRSPRVDATDRLRAIVLMELRRPEDAVGFLENLFIKHPDDIDVGLRLGLALQRSKKLDRSLQTYERLLGANPHHVKVLCGISDVLWKLGRLEESVAHAKQAATLEPDSADAHFALGFALQQSRRFREAAMSFDRAAQCREKNFIAEKHAVGAWLLAGEFASAWDRAERRHTWEDTLPAEYVRASAIEGEWPALQTLRHDARILVVGEHGLGDEVMFGSLLPEFGDLHPRLTVQLDARLVGLFARSLPEFSFSSHDDPTPPHDERVRLVSLPVVLRRDLASFRPARGGFLTADPARITTLRSVIGTQSAKLCGLSWKTINPFDGGIRSIDVAEFCKTLNVDGFRYVNLQYNTSPDEQRILKEQLGSALIDPGVDLFFDIEGVAALIDCCDVVVTVGNSVAHLAGALGRDTRVLIPYSPSWRWFGDSAESLWYSSIELIRQPMVGDWRDPLLRARQILQSFASQ